MSYFLKLNGVWQMGSRPIETFPVQVNRLDDTVPLVVAQEAYKEYAALYGIDQSLETLGSRGGFGASELANLLYQRIKRIEQDK